MAIIGTNIRVEVEQTLGSAVTVQSVSQANPGVAGATAHGFSAGDVVKFFVAGGMVELDGQAVRVAANVSPTNNFNLDGLDTSSYSAWTAGTVKKVTAFQTLSSAQSVTMPNPQPNKIEITTLIDKTRQYAYGLPEAPDGSITTLFNPGGVAEGLIDSATTLNTPLAFRITFAGTQKTVFNANVSGGAGFELGTNAAATGTISFTPLRKIMHYAT